MPSASSLQASYFQTISPQVQVMHILLLHAFAGSDFLKSKSSPVPFLMSTMPANILHMLYFAAVFFHIYKFAVGIPHNCIPPLGRLEHLNAPPFPAASKKHPYRSVVRYP